MPWKECSVMDERLQFVARVLAGEPMAELCGVSGPDLLNFGGREGIRTHNLLIANEEKSKLRLGATVT